MVPGENFDVVFCLTMFCLRFERSRSISLNRMTDLDLECDSYLELAVLEKRDMRASNSSTSSSLKLKRKRE